MSFETARAIRAVPQPSRASHRTTDIRENTLALPVYRGVRSALNRRSAVRGLEEWRRRAADSARAPQNATMASAGMASDEMPVMREPYDVMRNGLQGAKSAVTHLGKHPVQLIQDNVRPSPANDRRSQPEPCFTLKADPARPSLALLTRAPRIPSGRSRPCWRTPTGSPCPRRWTSSVRFSPSASPTRATRHQISPLARPCQRPKKLETLAFPPAAFTSADLRPIAPPPILVTTGRDGSPAFPRPGSASRS